MGNSPEMLAMLDNPQTIAILIPIVAIVGGLTFVDRGSLVGHPAQGARSLLQSGDPQAHNRGLGRRRQGSPRI